MRWCSLLLLMAMAMLIATPPSIAASLGSDSPAEFGVLDICHDHAPALSSSGDMPCVHECPCRSLPGVSLPAFVADVPLLPDILLVGRNERPPQS